MAERHATTSPEPSRETRAPHVPPQANDAPVSKSSQPLTHKDCPISPMANFGYGFLEHGVVDWLGNAAISLGITFNVMPDPRVQKGIDKLAQSIAPVTKALGAKHPEAFARTAAETSCMCAAGFLVMPAMVWLENNKAYNTRKLDYSCNAEFYKQNPGIKESLEQQAKEEDASHRKSWGKLISSRLAALGVVIFGIDQGAEIFNAKRRAAGKSTIDTVEWGIGSKLYDKLPIPTREKFINFFARRGLSTDSIQPMMREELIKTVGNDAKRMIFSEQARMIQKELSYTAAYAGMVYALVNMASKDKGEEPPKTANSPTAQPPETPCVTREDPLASLPSENWASRVEAKPCAKDHYKTKKPFEKKHDFVSHASQPTSASASLA